MIQLTQRAFLTALTKLQTKKIVSFINTRVDILKLIRRYGFEPTPDIGGRHKMKCILHNEGTASFFIYPNNSYYCFGCASGGGVINLMMNYEDKSFDEIIDRFKDQIDVASDRFFAESLVKSINNDSFDINTYKKNSQYQLGVHLRDIIYKKPDKADIIKDCYRDMDIFFSNQSIDDSKIVDHFIDHIIEKAHHGI
jgi:hypothetical protein